MNYVNFCQHNYDPITIRGVNEEEQGPSVTSCITYYLPCVVQWQQYSQTSGIVYKVEENTILGQPFQAQAGMFDESAENMVTIIIFGVYLPATHGITS